MMNVIAQDRETVARIRAAIERDPSGDIAIAYRLGLKDKSIELSRSVERMEAEIANLRGK